MVDPKGDYAKDRDLKKMHVFSLGYTYDLSKRTNLYAYGSYSKNYALVEDLKSTAVGVVCVTASNPKQGASPAWI